MEFPLRCDCGKDLVATDGMAGMSIPCACGRAVRVPSLREMRRHGPGYRSDEIQLSDAEVAEPLRDHAVTLLLMLEVGWILLTGLPLIAFSWVFGSPLTAAGALVLVGSQVWLFAQIFSHKPSESFVLLIPILGPILAIGF